MPSLELPGFHWKQLPNEGQLMSLYRGVIVCWDEDIDTRILEFVDNMPTHLRERLIAIGENQDFGTENFLTAQEASLSLSIKDLIFKRQIRVLGVECRAPQLNIIRLKDGRMNAQEFGVAKKEPQEAQEKEEQKYEQN